MISFSSYSCVISQSLSCVGKKEWKKMQEMSVIVFGMYMSSFPLFYFLHDEETRQGLQKKLEKKARLIVAP